MQSVPLFYRKVKLSAYKGVTGKNVIVIVGGTGTNLEIILYNAHGERLSAIQAEGDVAHLFLSENETLLVVMYESGDTRVHSLEGGKISIQYLPYNLKQGSAVQTTCCAINADRNLIAFATNALTYEVRIGRIEMNKEPEVIQDIRFLSRISSIQFTGETLQVLAGNSIEFYSCKVD